MIEDVALIAQVLLSTGFTMFLSTTVKLLPTTLLQEMALSGLNQLLWKAALDGLVCWLPMSIARVRTTIACW